MVFAAVAVVEAECEKSSATTYFWYREALDISNSISESGGLNWKMTLCLLVAWTIVGMAVVKGIQSSGKVSREGHLDPHCLRKAMEGRGQRTLGHLMQGPVGGLGLWTAQDDRTGPLRKRWECHCSSIVPGGQPTKNGLVEIMALTPSPLCSDNSCLLCKLKRELGVLTRGHLSRSQSLRVLSKSLKRACSAVLMKTRSIYSKRALYAGGCRE